MKKVDIRVFNDKGLEIDMNTLTDVVRERVEQLSLAYAMLIDEKQHMFRNCSPFDNDWDRLYVINGKLEKIEYELYSITKDYKSYRGVTLAKIGHGLLDFLGGGVFNLTLTLMSIECFVSSCYHHNLTSAFCFGYLSVFWAYQFKKELEVKKNARVNS
jgi:hypothetical protein